MKTFNGRVEDIYNNNLTNCDGMDFDEIYATLNQLKTIFKDKNLIFDGIKNVIRAA